MATVDDAVQSQARNIEQATGRSTSLTSAVSHHQTPRYWALTFSRDSDELAVARFRFESDEQLDLERRRQALPLIGCTTRAY